MPFGNPSGYVNPDGEANQVLGGSTQGVATDDPNTQDNSYEQTGVVAKPGVSGPSKADSIWPVNKADPTYQRLKQLDNLKSNFKYTASGFAQDGSLMLRTKRLATPMLNDNIRRIVKTGIPEHKAAESAVGLPEDLGLSVRDISDAIDAMQPYLQHMQGTNKADVAAQLGTAIQQAQEAYNTAQAQGDMKGAQEALGLLKIYTGRGSQEVANYIYSNQQSNIFGDETMRDMQLLYTIRDKGQEFEGFYYSDGKTLQNYVNQAMSPEVRMETVKATSLPSRQAKASLKNNRRYRQMAQSAYRNNPDALRQLTMDSSKPTITDNERNFIRAITPQIDAIENAKKAYQETHGRDAAQEQYRMYDDLIDMKYSMYKNMMDDIMGNVSNRIMSGTPTFNFINL